MTESMDTKHIQNIQQGGQWLNHRNANIFRMGHMHMYSPRMERNHTPPYEA